MTIDYPLTTLLHFLLKKIRLGSTSEAGSTLHESARLRGSARQAAVRTAKTYCCADSERVADIHGPLHCKDLRMVIYLLRVFYFLLARGSAGVGVLGSAGLCGSLQLPPCFA